MNIQKLTVSVNLITTWKEEKRRPAVPISSNFYVFISWIVWLLYHVLTYISTIRWFGHRRVWLKWRGWITRWEFATCSLLSGPNATQVPLKASPVSPRRRAGARCISSVSLSSAVVELDNGAVLWLITRLRLEYGADWIAISPTKLIDFVRLIAIAILFVWFIDSADNGSSPLQTRLAIILNIFLSPPLKAPLYAVRTKRANFTASQSLSIRWNDVKLILLQMSYGRTTGQQERAENYT